MKRSQMSLAAILLGATIVGTGAVSAQTPIVSPAGKAQVEIKEATTTTTTKAPSVIPVGGKTGSTRDPFVETSRAAAATPKTVKVVDTKVTKGAGGKTTVTKVTKSVPAAPVVVIKPPPVVVNGIVESRRGNYAILRSSSQTYIVRSGDKLGDYHVTGIGKRTVAFAFKDKSFKLPLESEFGGGTGAKKGASHSKK